MNTECYKNFEQMYLKLGAMYGKHEVFYDFVKMAAIALYNPLAKNQEMEQEYLRTIKKYRKEEQQLFPKMFSELVMMYQEAGEIKDILGPFYEKEKLGNSHVGQFFTPTHISDLMAKLMVGDQEKLNNALEKMGFISMNEPTCRRRRDDFVIR